MEKPQLFGAPKSLTICIIGLSLMFFYLRGVVVSDDAFITYRVVENLADGKGPVYNPSDKHFVSTTPLWTIVLAAGRTILPDTPIRKISKTLCAFLLVGSVLLLMNLFSGLGYYTLLLPIPILMNHEALDSGNEIALCFFLLTSTIWVYRKSQNLFYTGLVLALFYLARGEGALLGIPIAIDYIFRNRNSMGVQRLAGQIGLFAVGFVLMISGWHIYLYSEIGQWLPNTLKTKLLQGKSGYWALFSSGLKYNVIKSLRFESWLVPFSIVGAVLLTKKEWLLTAWVLTHTLAYSLMKVPNYDWYYYPISYYLSIGAFLSVPVLVSLFSRWGFTHKRVLVSVLTVGIAFGYLNVFKPHGLKTLTSKRSSEGGRVSTYRKVGLWLTENAPTELVGTDEIGVMGYFASKNSFVDPPGILIPDIDPKHIGTSFVDKMDYIVRRFKPAFLVFRTHEIESMIEYQTESETIRYQKVLEVDEGMKCAIYQRV